MKVSTTIEFTPVLLAVKAGVRYWEDATVNGVEDTDGSLIPFRRGDYWMPSIDLETGVVEGWPKGTTAQIHYKVCDDGEYWLISQQGGKVKWKGYYVPNELLCVGDNGYGDYIILSIDGDGKIIGWEKPVLDGDDWEVAQ